MKKKSIIIFGILAFLVVNTVILSVKGNYSDTVIIDGKRNEEEGYNFTWSIDYWPIYTANDENTFFVFIDFKTTDLEEKRIFLNIGVLTIDLSNKTVNTNYVKSIKNGTILEFAISRELINEQSIVKITVYEHVYLRRIVELIPVFHEKVRETSDFWLSWGITIIIIVVFIFVRSIEEFKRKKIVESWVEQEIDGKKVISKEMQRIGEHIKTELDPARNMYKLTFKHNFKKRIVYSEYSFEEFISGFRLRRYLVIFYMIEGCMFERKLSKPREVSLEHTAAWRAYFLFKAIYQFNIWGIFSSFLITGFTISAFSGFNFVVFLIAGFIGVLIGMANTFLYNKGVIKPKLKTKIVDTELILFPIQPKYRIEDIYMVTGKKLIITKKADKEQKEWVEFEEKINKFKTLIRMLNSDLFKEIQYKKIGEKKILRDPSDIKKSRHSNLYQMRYIYNQLLNARENNIRLQGENRDLFDRLAYLRETSDKERREFAMNILLEHQKTGKSFKEIIKQVFGDQQIDLKWDKVVERALIRLEREKKDKILERVEIISRILKNIVEKLTANKNIEFDNLVKNFKLKEEELLAETKKSESE